MRNYATSRWQCQGLSQLSKLTGHHTYAFVSYLYTIFTKDNIRIAEGFSLNDEILSA